MTDLHTTETLVRDRLELAARELPIPVERLRDGYRAEGRRVRRRRWIGASLAAASVVAGAGAGLPYALRGAFPTTTDVAGDPTVGTDPVCVPREPAWMGLCEEVPGWWSMPDEQMVSALGRFAPPGVGAQNAFPDERRSGSLVAMLIRDSTDIGTVTVDLYPPKDSQPPLPEDGPITGPDGQVVHRVGDGQSLEERISCPVPERDVAFKVTSCTELTDVSGRHYGRTVVSGWDSLVSYEVSVATDDDGLVEVHVGEQPDATWSGEAPWTLDQLQAIAEDPVWTSWVPPEN